MRKKIRIEFQQRKENQKLNFNCIWTKKNVQKYYSRNTSHDDLLRVYNN